MLPPLYVTAQYRLARLAAKMIGELKYAAQRPTHEPQIILNNRTTHEKMFAEVQFPPGSNSWSKVVRQLTNERDQTQTKLDQLDTSS